MLMGVGTVGNVGRPGRSTPIKGVEGLDFTRAMPARVAYARSGAASALTLAALFQLFAANAPQRTDTGLLLEAAATNLCPYSASLSNAAWVAPTNMTATVGQAGSFSSDAVLYTPAAGSLVKFLAAPNVSFTSGLSYACSVVIKPGTATRLQMTGASTAFGAAQYANFLLTGAGSVSASAGWTASIVQLGGGRYRLTIVGAATASVTAATAVLCALDTGSETRAPTVATTGTFTVEQIDLIQGSAASSPIVTTASAATRGLPSASVVVPFGYSVARATYGASNTVADITGLTPGANLDLVSGRPWVGLGSELKMLVWR